MWASLCLGADLRAAFFAINERYFRHATLPYEASLACSIACSEASPSQRRKARTRKRCPLPAIARPRRLRSGGIRQSPSLERTAGDAATGPAAAGADVPQSSPWPRGRAFVFRARRPNAGAPSREIAAQAAPRRGQTLFSRAPGKAVGSGVGTMAGNGRLALLARRRIRFRGPSPAG